MGIRPQLRAAIDADRKEVPARSYDVDCGFARGFRMGERSILAILKEVNIEAYNDYQEAERERVLAEIMGDESTREGIKSNYTPEGK